MRRESMRKPLFWAVLVLTFGMLGLVAQAEVGYQAVSANQTAQSVDTPGSRVLLVNDGSNEVYFRLFRPGQTAAAATTSSPELKSGESIEFTSASGYASVSLVCASGETATVRVFWES
jgi:hypothetical protein